MTSTRAINAAAGVIHAAMQQGKTLPQTQAYALDSAGLLNSPETAAELLELRKLPALVAELEQRAARYRIAWRMARTRALSTGGAADRYVARAHELQTALQDSFGAMLAMQMERDALRARVAELEAQLPYREVWSSELPPGGLVCSVCGQPVESEPCLEHAPQGTADEDPITYELTEQADVLTPLVEPNGCGRCGISKRTHGRQWTEASGWHPWCAPTQEQTKDRMRRRSAARLKALLAGQRDFVALEARLAVATTTEALAAAEPRILAELNREDPHDSELHHPYRLGRDLPEARP